MLAAVWEAHRFRGMVQLDVVLSCLLMPVLSYQAIRTRCNLNDASGVRGTGPSTR